MTDEEVDWARVARMAIRTVRRESVYAEAEALIKVEPRIQPYLGTMVFTGWGGSHLSAEQCIRDFLIYRVSRQRGPRSNDYSFDTLYSEFEGFFTSPSVPYRGLGLLDGFTMAAPTLDLASGLRIVQLSRVEREELLLHGMNSAMGTSPSSSGCEEFAVEEKFDEPVLKGAEAKDRLGLSHRARVYQDLSDVLSALRLFRRGAVWNPRRFYWPLRWIPNRSLTLLSGTGLHPPAGEAYVLDATGCADFPTFWNACLERQSTKGKRLGIAHTRLEAGYDRRRAEDRVIDCVVGLEALLQPEHAKTELSYRVSLRGAALLGRTPGERQAVFTEIKRAYDLRSAIVHGDDPEKVIAKISHEADTTKYLEGLEDLLRRTIRAWTRLRDGMSDREASQALDQKIIRGEVLPDT
ncbi:MAG: hypothetical protein AAB011_05615 [Candidatus Eisenbacteria bacterium]